MGKLVIIALTANLFATGYLLTNDAPSSTAAGNAPAEKTVADSGQKTGHKEGTETTPKSTKAQVARRKTTDTRRDTRAATSCPAAEVSHIRMHGQALEAIDIAVQVFETGIFDSEGQQSLYEQLLILRDEAIALFETWGTRLAACSP